MLEAVRSSLVAGGWLDPAWVSEAQTRTIVGEVVPDMTTVAAHFPLGSVVRRRLSKYLVGLSLPS